MRLRVQTRWKTGKDIRSEVIPGHLKMLKVLFRDVCNDLGRTDLHSTSKYTDQPPPEMFR